MTNIIFSSGTPYPLGVTPRDRGWNFAIYAKDVTSLSLCLFHDDKSLFQEIPLDGNKHRTGNVFHIHAENLPDNLSYGYRAGKRLLSDPFAKAIHCGNTWNEAKDALYPLGNVPSNIPFDWEDDRSPNVPAQDTVLYEMHVRGFTRHPSSNTPHAGTYLGIIEKIPHLHSLGVTSVELLPIHEFNECEYNRPNPLTHKPLCNYWGYSTVNTFSPMKRYASSNNPHAAVDEFKTMVKALHKQGIEVILDVVYNHTAEGSIQGPTYSYRGLDPHAYYMINPHGKYLDFSGCGNTFNCNHPVAIELIIASLRYWVTEMHVDGFRFDLATIFLRDPAGHLMPSSPLVNAITLDPILSSAKLISESWDAGGAYRVGSFAPAHSRWAEWNGHYRDDIRSFIKGDSHAKNLFATRLCGSQDMYGKGHSPCTSVNFVTCHDGFSLADLVAYNQKHNAANGEHNRDGTNDNRSWNCGVEGVTTNDEILALRQRQMRNFHVALMVSQGIPMVLMGDEYAHTKQGNNNAWCQDNELNWFLWDKLEQETAFHRFYRLMIQFRNVHPQLHTGHFLTDKDIVWHGLKPNIPEWDADNKFIAFELKGLYIAFNANKEKATVTLPPASQGHAWHWVVATYNAPPDDFFEGPNTPPAPAEITMLPFSAIILKQ